MRIFSAALVLTLIGFSSVVRGAEAPTSKPLEFPAEPKIAFIGNTLVERDVQQGYLETLLIAALPDRNITFRNLGWSGDNVRCESRSGFGQAADGMAHLARHVADFKPNVLFLNYGLNESFGGPAALPAFSNDLATLLDMLTKNAAPGAKLVLFSIIAQEDLGRPLPNPTQQNENIRLYNGAIAKLAAERGLVYLDLFDLPAAFSKAAPSARFTENAIHPSPAGWKFLGHEVARRMGVPITPWDDRLEQIRKLVREKNELFFHRWRPQNETYIFGFRKREQGRNAVEIPQFDPLIAEKEAAIAKLKK